MPDFAPCPICHQYSHSIGGDQLAAAFMHFQSMYSHRGDGIPTQYNFDEKTRDAAQALMAAASFGPFFAQNANKVAAPPAKHLNANHLTDYPPDACWSGRETEGESGQHGDVLSEEGGRDHVQKL